MGEILTAAAMAAGGMLVVIGCAARSAGAMPWRPWAVGGGVVLMGVTLLFGTPRLREDGDECGSSYTRFEC